VAPTGRISVELNEPSLRFRGHGYHDANTGDAPLEASFARWTWSRIRVDDRRTCVTYDVVDRTADERTIALDVDARRAALTRARPAWRLPMTGWRLDRYARGQGSSAPRILRGLEDTPFYARALLGAQVDGRPATGVHETLSLTRLSARWVRFLLPFRMGRG
jgi:carotenoid 1,2-hydratase